MNITSLGGIDCDVHPELSGLDELLPFLDDYWRESVQQRGLHELRSNSYPKNAPLSCRADWRPAAGFPGVKPEQLLAQALDPFGTQIAICNCLYGVQLLFSEDMAAGYARAINDWIASRWLDADPRLRASIVIPIQSVELAVDEIERCAADRRFVQVLVPAGGDMPLGRRFYWPIYAAAERCGLPVAIHAGSAYRHPNTPVGWASYYTEDYAGQASLFQAQLTSLICEGVFSKFPDLRVVLTESGVSWLPAYLWRLQKYWHGLRMEIPWVDRTPTEIVRSNVRLTVQPFDAPTDSKSVERLIDHWPAAGFSDTRLS